MKAVLQRVEKASVSVDNSVIASIGPGLLVLLGVHKDDREKEIDWLSKKIATLRIFNDECDKMNKSVMDLQYEVLVVSQFTLLANSTNGRRPDFIDAAKGEKANNFCNLFVKALEKELGKTVATGLFGAKMKVELINDGPVTIIIDSKSQN